MSAVAAALAERGIAMGPAVPRTGRLLAFTAPGVSALETTAALDAARVLHATFISVVPDPRLGASAAA
jgi:hypothetical protein